jgi:hypothetical protein
MPAERPISTPMKCGTAPAPGEPKFAWFGLALHQSRNSGMLRTDAGTAGPAAKPKSNVAPSDTGVTSVAGSYCSFL